MGFLFLGVNLRELRAARRLSQHALAQRAGPPFSQAYISRLEHGLQPSDPAHVAILAAVLRVSSRRLLQPPRPALSFHPRRSAATAPDPHHAVPPSAA